MSTKTTFKRIALVTVAALGFGVLTSVAPASAVPTEIDVAVRPSALAGATAVITPRPKAATATSATRLKVVFVDICFLSISQAQEFPDLGLELKFLTPVR